MGDFLEVLLTEPGRMVQNLPFPFASPVLQQSSAFVIFKLIMPPKSQVHNSGTPKGILALLHSMDVQLNNLTEQQDSAKVPGVSKNISLSALPLWLGGMQHPLPQHFAFLQGLTERIFEHKMM